MNEAVQKLVADLELAIANLKKSYAKEKPKRVVVKAKIQRPKNMLTVHEIAEKLNVDKSLVYKYVRNSILPKPVTKVGKTAYWDKALTIPMLKGLKRKVKK